MKVTIDRYENGFAVLLCRENESVKIDFPAQCLPEGCKEGDILDITICKDAATTDDARKRITDKLQKLKNKKF
jgi:hypothetical protein